MSVPAIEARGLTKRYGGTLAVERLDLQIDPGVVFGLLGLLGPNGSGKTTTILMLLGLTDVTSGTVRVLGLDPARRPLEVKRAVGYMPDGVGFYDELTARENLRYSGKLMGLRGTALETRIDGVLRRVRLPEAAGKPVKAFSRGMRQRLGLAEVLLKQPRLAILDEPTSGLDPQSTAEFIEMIRGLKADGITVLLSSHLLEQVQAVCDRVGLFHRGRMVLEGGVDELARKVLGSGSALPSRRAAVAGWPTRCARLAA
jgi:ABC-2 type transport system ATP-binding protein